LLLAPHLSLALGFKGVKEIVARASERARERESERKRERERERDVDLISLELGFKGECCSTH